MLKPRKPLPIPEDLQNVILAFEGVDRSGWSNDDLLDYANSLGDISDETRNFLQTADPAQDLQRQWNNQTRQGTLFMQKYGAAIKSTIASAGVMLVVSLALSTAFKLISDYIHRFENAKEALEDSVAKFEESKQKTEELTEELEECRDRKTP